MPKSDRTRVATAEAGGRIVSAFARDWKDYVVLTKPEISFLVAISSVAGFIVGSPEVVDWPRLVAAMIGIVIAASGACALNHAMESQRDAAMKRTASRPVASGRISVAQASKFGIGCLVLSVCWLCPTVNAATAGLAVVTALLYLLVYTPLKRLTTWNTVVGTIPGALPALGGYVAATNNVFSPVGWSLFAVLALWQLPHFYSLAWMYRKDYDRGDFKMISIRDETGIRTAAAAIAGCVALVGATLIPFLLGATGTIYAAGAMLIGLGLLTSTIRFGLSRTSVNARRLLKASVLYIPAFVVLLVVDHLI